jgi:nucleoside-diphosphate-sugar epimerase
VAEGDVRDGADVLAAAMTGCTHLVHTAGLVYASGEWPKVRAVNVDGTRHVLGGAADAGLRHAVHVSSVAVYGTPRGPIDERTPTDTDLPPGDLYARSKREAEDVARAVEEDRGLGVTILRPSAVYGERDRLMAPAVASILRAPIVPLLGQGDNTLPVVYAGNVAVSMRRALEEGRRGTTYDVAMDRPLTQRALFEGLAAVREGPGRARGGGGRPARASRREDPGRSPPADRSGRQARPRGESILLAARSLRARLGSPLRSRGGAHADGTMAERKGNMTTLEAR